MLHAAPRHLLSGTYTLTDEQGGEVGSLETSHWRERATLEIGNRTMRMYREGTFSGAFVLEHAGEVVVAAEKPSAWRNRFEMQLAEHVFELSARGWTGTHFDLRHGGEIMGRIERAGFFSRRTRVDLPEAWPPAVQAFALWLALLLWRRMESAS